MAEDRRVFGLTEDWSTTALDPGAWYNTVRIRKGLQVYDRVGRGRGKSAQKPAEEERGGRGAQG